MSRSLTSGGWAAIAAQQTDAVFVLLFEITTTDSPVTTMRLCNNNEDVSYGGNTWTAFPFDLDLPTDMNGQISEARIVLDNVSRYIVDEVRSHYEPLSASIYVVDASVSPPTLEASFVGFLITDVTYDANAVTGKLTLETYLNEPWPKDILSAAAFPGMF